MYVCATKLNRHIPSRLVFAHSFVVDAVPFSFVFALGLFCRVGTSRRGCMWLTWTMSAGEAIWDKPHVVAAREAHARALEERYSGLPQPLLLKVRAHAQAQARAREGPSELSRSKRSELENTPLNSE